MKNKVQIALVQYVGVSDYEGYHIDDIQLPDHMLDWVEVDVEDIPKIQRGLMGKRGGINQSTHYLLVQKMTLSDQKAVIDDCMRIFEEEKARERKRFESMQRQEKKKQRRKEIRVKIKLLKQSIESMPSNNILSPDVISAAVEKMKKEISDLELELKNK